MLMTDNHEYSNADLNIAHMQLDLEMRVTKVQNVTVIK